MKVLDFGLARLVSTSAQSAAETADDLGFETEPGTLLGAIRYMSPSRQGAEERSAPPTFFPLGVALYEVAAIVRYSMA